MPTKELAKQRLVQTFRFLKGLNELRNPVPRDLDGSEVIRLAEWPAHPCIQVHRGDPIDVVEDDDENADPEPPIRIQRAKLTPCPRPPATLETWLNSGWDLATAKLEILESRNVRTASGDTTTARFVDDPSRVAALRSWTVVRDRWAEAERPALAARAVFERAHELWTKLQREGDRVELMLADGVLCVPEHAIRHPVLLQRLSLEFDPALPEFRLFADADHMELHRPLLRLIPGLEGRTIAQFNKDLEEQPVEPLGGSNTDGFFR